MTSPDLQTETICGIMLTFTSWLAYLWAEAYPVITGLSAICGLIIGLHGAARIAWRYCHGYF